MYKSEKEIEIEKIIEDFIEKYKLDDPKKITEDELISINDEEEELIINEKKKEKLERIRDKSIGKSKKVVIHGETYKRKNIDREILKEAAAICVACLVTFFAIKGIDYLNVQTGYETMLNHKIKEDGNLFVEGVKEEINHSKSDNYKNYKEAYENLDDYEYDFFGNRKNGNEGSNDIFDEESLFNLTQKQMDAIDIATDKELGKNK